MNNDTMFLQYVCVGFIIGFSTVLGAAWLFINWYLQD